MYFIKMHYKSDSKEFDLYKGIINFISDTIDERFGYKTLHGVRAGLKSLEDTVRLENEAGYYQLTLEIVKI